ncbi:hypothetical protein FVE85_4949 [Porphyridium purpureum]|uniref:Uncharacterized protein n=1 Tax=Porphyridium purpureum TaxID=35688 RepID=A0A5J4YSI6_PORPP|nr:hypothetical protein FVE85_4949 [Porphyridium purpureum]|eukprot:POR0383..scf236_6
MGMMEMMGVVRIGRAAAMRVGVGVMRRLVYERVGCAAAMGGAWPGVMQARRVPPPSAAAAAGMQLRMVAHTTVAQQGLGIADKVMNYFSRSNDAQQRERMQSLYDSFFEIWTDPRVKKVLPEHIAQIYDKVLIESGAGGWREKLPWVKSNEELEQVRKQVNFFRALPGNYIVRDLGRARMFREVAKSVGLFDGSEQAAISLLWQARVAHQIIRYRMKMDYPLPRTYDELQRLMVTHRYGVRRFTLEQGQIQRPPYRKNDRKQMMTRLLRLRP